MSYLMFVYLSFECKLRYKSGINDLLCKCTSEVEDTIESFFFLGLGSVMTAKA